MSTNSGLDADGDAMLKGQAQIWQYIYNALDSMSLRCCVELSIADIINNHGCPMTLSQIAYTIASPSLNIDGLSRLMRFLVHKKVFDEMPQPGEGNEKRETLYSLNHCSKWLLRDSEITLAPMVMMRTDPSIISPLHNMNRSIEEGGTTFKKTHGEEMWDFASINPEFNRIFNEGMACTARITMNAIMSNYENGFLDLKGTIVDVGGGVGVAICEIVKAYSHLKGINFDLPHVVANAPMYGGVTHVGGDMFKAIPHANSIFMKWIMHDWSDDDCVKILKNCRKAIPETGKVIIVDVVLNPAGDGIFDDTRRAFDLVMFAHFSGGKERTEIEWKKILNEGGFCRYNIIKIPALQSIIEAFPQ